MNPQTQVLLKMSFYLYETKKLKADKNKLYHSKNIDIPCLFNRIVKTRTVTKNKY